MKKESTSVSIGFFGLLTLLFIALKLMGYIVWSWFWVLSPLLFPLIIWLAVFVFIGIVAWVSYSK